LGATEGEIHAEDERTEEACSPPETTHASLGPAINSHNMSFVLRDRQSRRSDAPSYHRVVKPILQRILPLPPAMLALGTLVENLAGCLG
jgi:hypothetical protein